MHHLTLRVAWHDNRWNGTICRAPSLNGFCLDLPRIRETRKDAAEDADGGAAWGDLDAPRLPPCVNEGGGFMSEREWIRIFRHPYRDIKKAQATHGCLKDTLVKVPPYAAFAVPFKWMLTESQQGIDETLPTPLPHDGPLPGRWAGRHNGLVRRARLGGARSLVRRAGPYLAGCVSA